MTALELVTLVSKYKLLLLLLPLLLSILSLELLSLPQADLYHLEQDLLHLLNLAQGLLHFVLRIGLCHRADQCHLSFPMNRECPPPGGPEVSDSSPSATRPASTEFSPFPNTSWTGN